MFCALKVDFCFNIVFCYRGSVQQICLRSSDTPTKEINAILKCFLRLHNCVFLVGMANVDHKFISDI